MPTATYTAKCGTGFMLIVTSTSDIDDFHGLLYCICKQMLVSLPPEHWPMQVSPRDIFVEAHWTKHKGTMCSTRGRRWRWRGYRCPSVTSTWKKPQALIRHRTECITGTASTPKRLQPRPIWSANFITNVLMSCVIAPFFYLNQSELLSLTRRRGSACETCRLFRRRPIVTS